MKKLYLNIVSPEKEIYNGEIESVTLPGTIGTFTILPQHAPIVSSLREGKVIYVPEGGEEQTLIPDHPVNVNSRMGGRRDFTLSITWTLFRRIPFYSGVFLLVRFF